MTDKVELEDRRIANGRVRRLNWILLPCYFFIVLEAMIGEMFTRYSLATFGYYYIMLGMPGWMVCWFALLIINEVYPVGRSWLYASILVGGLAVVGYLNIG